MPRSFLALWQSEMQAGLIAVCDKRFIDLLLEALTQIGMKEIGKQISMSGSVTILMPTTLYTNLKINLWVCPWHFDLAAFGRTTPTPRSCCHGRTWTRRLCWTTPGKQQISPLTSSCHHWTLPSTTMGSPTWPCLTSRACTRPRTRRWCASRTATSSLWRWWGTACWRCVLTFLGMSSKLCTHHCDMCAGRTAAGCYRIKGEVRREGGSVGKAEFLAWLWSLKKMCAGLFLKFCLFHLLLVGTSWLSTELYVGLPIISIL